MLKSMFGPGARRGPTGTIVSVTEIEDLSPRVRRVRFSAPALQGLTFEAGAKIKLRIGSVMRSYTPARSDASAGWIDVLFFLHGSGPGHDWATAASPGAELAVFGPKSSLPPCSRPVDWAAFLGDETTLGPALALLGTLPAGCRQLGAIEVDAVDVPSVARLGLPLKAALRTDTRGAALMDWLAQTTLPDGPGIIWLSGHHGTVCALRDALAARGIPREWIHSKSYWNRPKDKLRGR